MINPFKKKNKLKKDDEGDTSKASTPKYKIVLLESLGKQTREVRRFDAQRFIDETDNVVYLRNEKLKFFEIFPEDEPQKIDLTTEEIDRKLEEIQKLLKSPKVLKEKGLNPKNLEYDQMKFGAQKRALSYGTDASYISFDQFSAPTFYFLRKGSTFYPFKWDTDTSTVYAASDNKKKKSTIALRNKEHKYKTKKFVETSTLIFLLIVLVVGLVEIWGATKMFKSYDDSEIAAIKRACVEDVVIASEAIEKSAKSVSSITDKIAAQINKPDVVIAGITPK